MLKTFANKTNLSVFNKIDSLNNLLILTAYSKIKLYSQMKYDLLQTSHAKNCCFNDY